MTQPRRIRFVALDGSRRRSVLLLETLIKAFSHTLNIESGARSARHID
jgi:hypothetical protein